MYYYEYLLGDPIRLNTWGCNLSPADEAFAVAQFRQAFAIIAGAAGVVGAAITLPAQIVNAIAQVKEIIIPSTSNANLGASKGGATLSLPYIKAFSVQWLASCIAHEGQHHLNAGMFSGGELWRDEQSACITQLALAQRIDMPASEITYLESWMADANQATMLEHMKGYTLR